ncbi:MAG: aspartate-semialdehyde dehydrogenase [bacterium]|nr:aspartate-semialdehyde dehydrogenase [bacterium]
MRDFTFAIVGALGNVGTEMRGTLEKSKLPIGNLVMMDVAENVGQVVKWRDREISVVEAAADAFAGVDIALFSAGEGAALELVPEAVKHGCVCVDNSTAFRGSDVDPLVVPEVNAEALTNHRGIIANPNCSTIQMLVVLKPIHEKYTIKRVVVSTYQAVSGSGQAAVDELHAQTRAFAEGRELEVNVYPHQIAFNALPHIDSFVANGYTKEEMKMIDETHKILDPAIGITTTTVRMPVVNGHSESMNIETEKPFEIDEVRELLAGSRGIIIEDDPGNNVYPLAINAAGQDPVYVGRLRRDESIGNGMNMWCVADNLLKGAALNTVQIAAELIERDLVRVPGDV